MVTVLFADLVGFTAFAHARPAAEVVAVLNRLLPASSGNASSAEMALDMCDAVDRFRT